MIISVESWGIFHQSTNTITLTGNAVYGNGAGVYSSGAQIAAQNVYWGDPSGPYHNPSNLTGLANQVSDNVIFSPWGWDQNHDLDQDGIPDSIDPDDDNDGIPDQWEIDYGFDPFNYSDAFLDADNDGYSNLEEYLNNTNPLPTCGDLNDDINIDLADLIMSLKLLAGLEIIEIRNGFCAGNSTIDMGEALYILQEVSQ